VPLPTVQPFGPENEILISLRTHTFEKRLTMTVTDARNSQMFWARLAGFLYLFTYVVPMTGWAITGRYEVPGDFIETAHRVMTSEQFYRFGLCCLTLNGVLCMFLAIGLYAALKPANSTLALFGLLFRLAENMLGTTFSLLDFVAVKAYSSPEISAAFTPKQLSAFLTLLAEAGAVQFNMSMVLLGIGSAFFFYVFLRSGYIPKALSILGLCATPIFAAVSLAYLFWPQYSTTLRLGWFPMALAEISIGFWLLIKGVNTRPQP
jgi:hypothetical protein